MRCGTEYQYDIDVVSYTQHTLPYKRSGSVLIFIYFFINKLIFSEDELN